MAHILGVLAVITGLLSFQLKTRKNIITANLTSRILYILQYVFLGAFEGAALDLCGLVFSLVAKYKDTPFVSKYLKLIVLFTNLIIFAVGFALYENVFSIFAILGVFIEVMALWHTKEKNIRFLTLFACPPWLVYNLTNSAYGSVIGNILLMVSIAVAMLRLDFKKGENV